MADTWENVGRLRRRATEIRADCGTFLEGTSRRTMVILAATYDRLGNDTAARIKKITAGQNAD